MTRAADLMASGMSAGQAESLLGRPTKNLTATGTSYNDALDCPSDFLIFTTVPVGSGVRLPRHTILGPNPGDSYLIINNGLHPLTIYGPTGGTVSGAGAVTLDPGGACYCVCYDTDTWTQFGGTVTTTVTVPANVTSTSMPSALVGSFYEFTPTADGIPQPVWTVTAAPPIPGMTFDSASGKVSMTVPAAGTYVFTFTVDNGVVDSQDITFTALASLTNATITSVTLEDVFVGQTPVIGNLVRVTCAGDGPYTFSMTAGSAPSGTVLVPTAIADPATEGIFFGTPDTAGAGTSMTLKVTGASGVLSAGVTFPNGVTVYQFPDISTTTFPDLSSNTAVGSAHNVTMTGYPAPTNLSITSGGPPGFALSGTGVASGNVGFASAALANGLGQTYSVALSCSTTCGSFGVKTATRTIPLLVYVGTPTGMVYGWDAQFGKTLDGSGKCTDWASFVGSSTMTVATYTSLFGGAGAALAYDSANVLLGNTGAAERIAAAPGTIAVPHHVVMRVKLPTGETAGATRQIGSDNGFSPSFNYVDNGSGTHHIRYANGGVAITSANTAVRGDLNTYQGWTASATNLGIRLSNETEVTTTGASSAGSIANIGLFPPTALANCYLRRIGFGSQVMDRDWCQAWAESTYVPGTPPPNPGPNSASITYPASSSTMRGGIFKIKVSRGTVPQAGTTGCDIYENNVLMYSYTGDGGASGTDWDYYIHHANSGTYTLKAIVRNSIYGDTTTADITNVTVPAKTNGTFEGLIMMQHMHQSGGQTGRLRVALPDNPYNAVLTNSKIGGIVQNLEWKDYETAEGVYTMNNILTNSAYCAARGKFFMIDIFTTSFWGGASDTSAVPTYIRDGSTATYGAGYTGAGNVLNGKAGVSGKSTGGSTPHFWNTNVMNRWKLWVDYLASQLLPNGIGGEPYPGFIGVNLSESTWAVQANNNANAALINAYGGNQGYSHGALMIYWDMLQYIQSKFGPGIPVFPGWNYPDNGGSTPSVPMNAAMDRARNAGFRWTGIRDYIQPDSPAPFHDYGQWGLTTAELYDAYWPFTERAGRANPEAPGAFGPSGDRTPNYWVDTVDASVEFFGFNYICYGLTDNGTYPSTNWTSTQAWTAMQYLRDRTTVADIVTNP